MHYLRQFNEEPFSLPLLGGKGLNLSFLSNHFNVPFGFIITTKAYEKFIQENKLDKVIAAEITKLKKSKKTFDDYNTISQNIRKAFHNFSLPQDIKDEITAVLTDKQKTAFAVRSSATAEDLPYLSFAGQHDTFLNVKDIETIFLSVVQCFSSLWSPRAIQYREVNGINHFEVLMAVVIQEMIPSDFSGVMFTANPVTGNRNQIVIEAIYGLGEALVSGMVEPDTYICNEDSSYTVEKSGAQKQAIVANSTGTGTKVIEFDTDKQLLDSNQIIALCELGTEIQQLFSKPQDIEWAIKDDKIFILQSREITTLYPTPDNISSHPLRILMSLNTVQGVLEPFTPLGKDILVRFIYGFGITLNLTTSHSFYNQKTVLFSAERIWIDITNVLQNKLGQKAILGFLGIAEPETKAVLNHILKEKKIKTKRSFPSPNIVSKIRYFLVPFIKQIKRTIKNPTKQRKEKIEEQLNYFNKMVFLLQKCKSLEKKTELIEQLIFRISKSVLINIGPFIPLALMSLKIIDKISDAKSAKINVYDLARSSLYNPTTEMNLALWNVALTIKKNPLANEIFQNNSIDSIVQLYLQDDLPIEVKKNIDSFLIKYGFRGFVEIDVGKERWKENPKQIFSLLKTYVELSNPEEFPDNTFQKNKINAYSVYQNLFALTTKSKFGRIKGHILNFFVRLERRTMGMREYPKFVLSRFFSLLRDSFLEIGSELVSKEILNKKEDIFYLNFDTLKEIHNHKNEIKDIVKQNKLNYMNELKRTQLPLVLLSNGETFYRAPRPIKNKEGLLVGSPVSSGVAKGKAKVLFSPIDAKLSPGEILVCPATDPSWTPLFQVAKGLVMEIGGMMTHGGVVAREHGIPAVVGIQNATLVINDGDLIRVDGNAGTVEILKKKAE